MGCGRLQRSQTFIVLPAAPSILHGEQDADDKRGEAQDTTFVESKNNIFLPSLHGVLPWKEVSTQTYTKKWDDSCNLTDSGFSTDVGYL